MTIGTYILEFTNGYYYLGSSLNVEKRINDHRLDIEKGRHHNKKITAMYNDTKELPTGNLIEVCTSETRRNNEQILLDMLFRCPYNLNQCQDAYTSKGYSPDNDTRLLWSVQRKDRTPPNKITQHVEDNIKNECLLYSKTISKAPGRGNSSPYSIKGQAKRYSVSVEVIKRIRKQIRTKI